MHPRYLASVLLATVALSGQVRAVNMPDPVHGADSLPRVEIADKLVTVADDHHFELVMHPPTVVMTGDGRQPYLFCSADGTLFCQAQLNLAPFYTKKKEVYHGRIGSAISRDSGATWQRWTHQENHDDVNIEGGMAQGTDGTILLLDTYVMPTDRPDHGVGELWKSRDDLRTFEGPIDIDFTLPKVNWGGSTADNGTKHSSARLHRSLIELPNGDWLTLMYTRFEGDVAPSAYMPTMLKSRCVVIRSSDHGATWSYLSTIGVDSGVGTEGFGEPVMVRVTQGLHAGRLVCLMRTGREMYGSHSDDGGVTWRRPQPVRLPGVDIYKTEEWENLYVDKRAPRYMPISEMLGAVVDPDLIEMKDGTLVCAFGVRTPARLFLKNWRAVQNGDYLAFSRDGGATWSHVVRFRSAAPTTQYLGVREIKPGLLYVVYDDNIWNMPGSTLGFQLEVKRAESRVPAGLKPTAALAARARMALLQTLRAEQGVPRLHAAEALVANGDAARVKPIFQAALAEGAKTPFVRIGLWRVLARCASKEEERRRWVDAIENTLTDPAATDHINAVESVCKLGEVLKGAQLAAVRKMAETLPEPDTMFPLWEEVLAGDKAALAGVVKGLNSKEVVSRLRASYILGWLKVSDPAVLAQLASAADREPEGVDSYPYVLGAAYLLNANPAHMAAWHAKMEKILQSGAPLARAEVCRCLSHRDGAASLRYFLPLLGSLQVETRTGAATAILWATSAPVPTEAAKKVALR